MTAPADPQAQDFEVTADLASLRLDIALAKLLNQTRNEARRAIEDGAVYVQGTRCLLPARKLQAGERVRVLPQNPDRSGIDEGTLRIVHRDDSLLVVHKPAGLPTQPPPRGGDALSLRVKQLLGPDAYVGELHRLDRDVSGLVVYGLTPEATAHVADQLRLHSATRRYLALVHTAIPLPPQTITEPIRELAPGRMGLHPTGMPARTHVLPLDFSAQHRVALALVALETGRSHQIRLHLAWAAGALLGDKQYGDTQKLPRIGLHAAVLSLHHPQTRERVQWILEPPADFWALTAAPLHLPADWSTKVPGQEV